MKLQFKPACYQPPLFGNIALPDFYRLIEDKPGRWITLRDTTTGKKFQAQEGGVEIAPSRGQYFFFARYVGPYDENHPPPPDTIIDYLKDAHGKYRRYPVTGYEMNLPSPDAEHNAVITGVDLVG